MIFIYNQTEMIIYKVLWRCLFVFSDFSINGDGVDVGVAIDLKRTMTLTKKNFRQLNKWPGHFFRPLAPSLRLEWGFSFFGQFLVRFFLIWAIFNDMDISEFSILSIFIRTGPCSGLNELEEEYDCKDIIMIIILKMSYFWKFGPFSDSTPFQLYSHHILCPTGPMKE